jgi:hypothetical protein
MHEFLAVGTEYWDSFNQRYLAVDAIAGARLVFNMALRTVRHKTSSIK